MSFSDMDTDDDRYLTIKAGQSVQLHIVSKEPNKSVFHWIDRKKHSHMNKNCEHCENGDSPKKSWKIKVIDRKSGLEKEYEFGKQVAAQIKTISEILAEGNQTVHDVDIRIKREGSGQFDTEYFVNQVPMKPSSPVETKIQEPPPEDEEEVPF